MGRTGSNFLTSSLRSLPGVKAFGEVFNDDQPERILWETRQRTSTHGQVRLRTQQPARFLEQVVFGPKPRDVQAVGFKLFYYHARSPHQRVVWERLREMDVQVIHLRRRNLLELHLSMLDAMETGRWSQETPGVAPVAPVHHLDPDECKSAFLEISRWQKEARAYFAAQQVLDVLYEDLVSDYPREMNRVEDFLGLPRMPAKSPLIKQNTRPLHERITNYEALQVALRATEWSSFLH